MPGSERVADPGFVAVIPGNGEIMMQPVSVCHQVSTMGQSPWPMDSLYQIHASGLIGSPTVPISRREESLYFAGNSSPQRMNVRIAVGAVYKMLTPYLSMSDQKRPRSGKSGVPS